MSFVIFRFCLCLRRPLFVALMFIESMKNKRMRGYFHSSVSLNINDQTRHTPRTETHTHKCANKIDNDDEDGDV